MAKVYHQIINLTNKPPSLRTDEELDQLVPWLRKKSSNLFHDLENEKIKKLLKEADLRRYRFDDVILRQGDEGDEFFILVSGAITFYVNSTDDVETMVAKQKQEEAVAREQGRPVNREVYGTQVGTGTEGKTFGELALIYPDCVRNASVLSTNIYSDVLVVSKDLYNETILGSQVREYEAKEKFINDSPLFHKWNPKLRKMAAMSIEKIKLKFEDVIIKQGSPINGLHFLVSGQVKIRVDPSMHPLQFPQHFPVGNLADLEKQKARELLRKEMNLGRSKSSTKKTSLASRSAHHEGNKKSAQKALELCLMGAVDTIGDVEMVLGVSTYSQTVICTEAATVFHLDQRNYDRLVEKRNPQTVDFMRDIVHTKLTLHFSRLSDDSIPMYRYILYTLDEKERETRERRQKLKEQQERDRHTTVATPMTETQWEIENLQKGPLVNLYGPGSVFHWIRKKAKERQQKQTRAKAGAKNQNPAFRFGKPQQQQTSPFGRTPLADNTRFLYTDDTSSISDTHIVNLYGYNEDNTPRFVNGEYEEHYDGDLADYDDYYEEEDEDWATSDMALSNLEERIQRWHSSFKNNEPASSSAKQSSTAALSVTPSAPTLAPLATQNMKGDHCVVRLHRAQFGDEHRPKPGNKVYVRPRGERQKTFTLSVPPTSSPTSSPELDKSFSKYLLHSPRTPQPSGDQHNDICAAQCTITLEDEESSPKILLPKRASSARMARGSRFQKKPRSRHQYTMEEYQMLKEELRRRQKAYKSFLPARSNTVLF
ncbi:uncharacterized protein [Littorina saxatilis]